MWKLIILFVVIYMAMVLLPAVGYHRSKTRNNQSRNCHRHGKTTIIDNRNTQE